MEDLLLDMIVSKVLKKIQDLNRKKILVIIRDCNMKNIDVIETTVDTMLGMDMEVHLTYECGGDENLYTSIYHENLKQVTFPKTSGDMECLLKKYNYKSIIINYLSLEEINNLLKLDIKEDFTSILFSIVYKNLEIYTSISEFNGFCKNQVLNNKIEALVSNLRDINVNLFPLIRDRDNNLVNKNVFKEKDTLVIDKNIVTLSDLYNQGDRNIVLNSDAIITAMAKDYIRDENIIVRRR